MGNFCVHFLNGFTGFFVKAVISILLLIIKHAKSQGHSCMASLVVALRLNFSIIICFVYYDEKTTKKENKETDG